MKPVEFTFNLGSSVEDSLAKLSELGEDCKIIAGGQSLGPMLNYRVVRPTSVIDIGRIAVLREISHDADKISIGAAVSHAAIEDWNCRLPLERFLSKVARGIAYRAIRNRGTIGGSLAHADPAADWPVVVSALNAEIEIRSLKRLRIISARKLFLDQMETALAPHEVLTRITIERGAPRRTYGYYKIARKTGEFADSISAVCLDLKEERAISEANVWLGAALATPCQLTEVERLLKGKRAGDWSPDWVSEAVRGALPSPENEYERYKLQLHCVAVARALQDALGSSIND